MREGFGLGGKRGAVATAFRVAPVCHPLAALLLHCGLLRLRGKRSRWVRGQRVGHGESSALLNCGLCYGSRTETTPKAVLAAGFGVS